MAVPVIMPRLGETVTEGTIVKWLKHEGEYINKDESLVEVSTAKVETELPSPTSGRVAKIIAQEDQTVPVGADIAEIEEMAKPAAPEEVKPPEKAAAPAPVPPPEIPPAPAAAAAPIPAPAPAPTPARPIHAVEHEKAPLVPTPEAKPPEVPPPPGFISPVVRKLAREHNVNLSEVTGTGAGGRITRQDVERYIALQQPAAPGPPKPPIAQAPPISLAPMPSAEVPEHEIPGMAAMEAEAKPAVPPAAPGLPGEQIVEVPHMRYEIAKHMIQSWHTAAKITALVEVDMTGVVKQREKFKDAFKKREGFSLTYLPFVAKATIDALQNFPMVNARIVDEHHIALHNYINLGIAVAIEDGLIVPVIKDADRMNLTGLARSVHTLAEKARTGKLSPDEVTGSTFTITNPGSFGSIIQTPIINQPNVAILSLELIQKRPVVVDEAIAIRQMVFMPLSYDHRLIDGAMAAQFLNRIKHNLETWDFTPDLAYLI